MRIICATAFSLLCILLQCTCAYSMEEKEEHHCNEDEIIRGQMRDLPRDVLETLNSPRIPYFNIFDPEGRLIATIDGNNNHVYTYREIQGRTSLSHHSIEAFKVIINADSQLEEEKKPLIIDDDYERAVKNFGSV